MGRHVDRAGEERRVDFLGEQALAAGLGKRTILDPIAGRPNVLKRDRLELPAMRLCGRSRVSFACRIAEGGSRAPSGNKAGEVVGAA